jgi:hypothetical protein
MKWARYLYNPPFSRKVRLQPRTLVQTGVASDLARLPARLNEGDALCGTLSFLFSIYRNQCNDARRLLGLLEAPSTRQELSDFFLRKDLRKLFIGCFREALSLGGIARPQAELLLQFAARFDQGHAKTVLQIQDEAGAAAQAPPRPIQFDYVASIPAKLRVVLLFETNAYSPGSRNHDLGERIQSAFEAAAIDCRLLPPDVDPAEIGDADLVILNEDALFPRDEQKKRERLAQIRARARRLVRLIPDPWGHWLEPSLKDRSHFYDFMWTLAPSLKAKEAEIGCPIWTIPFPVGFNQVFDQLPPPSTKSPLSFCGAVEDYNLVRYYWLLFGLTLENQIGVTVTNHGYDGLPVADSLKLYLAKLLRSRACLNLTMRATGQRIVIGRAFDILKGGRLLVQEYAADVRPYLTPGEHFLEFRSFEELAELNENLGAADSYADVQRHGVDYYRRHYSDDAIVRHVLTWI